MEGIKDTMDEKGEIPESIYFFYGGESEQFVQALEFIGLSPINREFASFLLSDLGLKTMTQNKLSIHVESRVYQQLHNDTSALFAGFIRSLSVFEIQDMNEDIVSNGWEVKKISEVTDSQEMLKIFQDFYSLKGRLPLSNSLLVVPDGDAPPDEKLNMKQLYDLFKNTDSHGIVSLPFLGLIQFYLEENDHTLTKNAISELCYNLSYSTLVV